MRKTLLAFATAATVIAAILPAYAQQNIDCTVVTRANWTQCTFQNSQSGKEG